MAAENGSTRKAALDLGSPGVLLAVYTAAIFLSAALLFAVQPLFTKMVLPRLGGSPSVWCSSRRRCSPATPMRTC
jgi:hypothetical protein